MPEHFRALIVILAVAAIVFFIAERSLCPNVIGIEDFRRRRNAWLTITVIAFLSHNLWVYAVLSTVVALAAARRDKNPLAIYILLLFAVPMHTMQVPGFGLINYILTLNHIRILNLAILLPVAINLAQNSSHEPRPVPTRIIEVIVLTYIFYTLARRFPLTPLTSSLRDAIELLIDIWLPFFVASRFQFGIKKWREILGAFFISAAIMAPLGIFETIKGWLLYGSLRGAFNISSAPSGTYLLRGDDGALRAIVTSDHSIVFGYVMMISIVLFRYTATIMRSKYEIWTSGTLLAGGLIAALSRGPWVGAALGLLVFVSLRKDGLKRLAWTVIGTIFLLAVSMFFPLGKKIVDYLPFIGTVDEGSVTYRQRLAEVSLTVFWDNPVFGNLQYLNNSVMEEMRQGQGIIDIVNTYLAIALPYGAIGLILFLIPFFYAGVACWRALPRSGADYSNEYVVLGQTLLSTLIAAMITIATVSSIGSVPTLYWLIAGLCIGYSKIPFDIRDSTKLYYAPAETHRHRSWGVKARTRAGSASDLR